MAKSTTSTKSGKSTKSKKPGKTTRSANSPKQNKTTAKTLTASEDKIADIAVLDDTGSSATPPKDKRQSTDRRKVQRRRQIDPTTCERDYSSEEIEFMRAMDDYKRANGRMFPTCSEILEVVRDLGYVRSVLLHASTNSDDEAANTSETPILTLPTTDCDLSTSCNQNPIG